MNIATAALLLWPLIALAFFLRMRLEHALLTTIVAGYLLLPERAVIDLPLLPDYDKRFAPAIAAFALCVLFAQSAPRAQRSAFRAAGWLPQYPVMRVAAALLLFSPILTMLTNRDSFAIADRSFQALTFFDAGNYFYAQIANILPFLLARRYLRDADGARLALQAVVVAGLAYSLLIAVEIRLSPQFHQWVYGYRPFNFAQQMRGELFRPVVFLRHGLWTAIFVAMALVATIAFARVARGDLRVALTAGAIWLFGILVMTRSFAALVFGFVCGSVAWLGGQKLRLLFVAAIAVMVLSYPMMRSLGLIPTDRIVSAAARLDPDRAQSLQFRFKNEDILLERANERPFFGWGGYNRGRVFDEVTGQDVSTTDGRWMITFGAYGWAGYLGEYGLLTGPILLFAFRRRKTERSDALIGLGLVLSVNLLDILPNASLTPLTWLLAGAMLAQVEQESSGKRQTYEAAPATRRSRAVIGTLHRDVGRRQ